MESGLGEGESDLISRRKRALAGAGLGGRQWRSPGLACMYRKGCMGGLPGRGWTGGVSSGTNSTVELGSEGR